MHPKYCKGGFSLVEISIVLFVIGLIAGGIVAGSALIRNSELQTVMSEVQQYSTAISSFKDKYNALPGDMANATTIWGAEDPTPATCQTTASTTKLTCDGNGDGYVTQNYEMYRLWQHLNNAELITGIYSGVAGGGGQFEHLPGSNSPASKVEGIGFGITHLRTNPPPATEYFSGEYGNTMYIGRTRANSLPTASAFSPGEMLSIDVKRDDGKPGTGNIRSFMTTGTWSPGCANSDVAATAAYTTSSNILCSMLYIQGF